MCSWHVCPTGNLLPTQQFIPPDFSCHRERCHHRGDQVQAAPRAHEQQDLPHRLTVVAKRVHSCQRLWNCAWHIAPPKHATFPLLAQKKPAPTYLWNARATGVGRKHTHQGHGQERKQQGPQDVHQVVENVSAGALGRHRTRRSRQPRPLCQRVRLRTGVPVDAARAAGSPGRRVPVSQMLLA